MKRDIAEQKFLDEYDPSAFPPIAVAVDAVVFGISKSDPDNYRKLGKQSLNILLIRRNDYPFKNKRSLPGAQSLPEESAYS